VPTHYKSRWKLQIKDVGPLPDMDNFVEWSFENPLLKLDLFVHFPDMDNFVEWSFGNPLLKLEVFLEVLCPFLQVVIRRQKREVWVSQDLLSLGGLPSLMQSS
jgi:hypothetical protein